MNNLVPKPLPDELTENNYRKVSLLADWAKEQHESGNLSLHKVGRPMPDVKLAKERPCSVDSRIFEKALARAQEYKNEMRSGHPRLNAPKWESVLKNSVVAKFPFAFPEAALPRLANELVVSMIEDVADRKHFQKILDGRRRASECKRRSSNNGLRRSTTSEHQSGSSCPPSEPQSGSSSPPSERQSGQQRESPVEYKESDSEVGQRVVSSESFSPYGISLPPSILSSAVGFASGKFEPKLFRPSCTECFSPLVCAACDCQADLDGQESSPLPNQLWRRTLNLESRVTICLNDPLTRCPLTVEGAVSQMKRIRQGIHELYVDCETDQSFSGWFVRSDVRLNPINVSRPYESPTSDRLSNNARSFDSKNLSNARYSVPARASNASDILSEFVDDLSKTQSTKPIERGESFPSHSNIIDENPPAIHLQSFSLSTE
eukprot:801711_1